SCGSRTGFYWCRCPVYIKDTCLSRKGIGFDWLILIGVTSRSGKTHISIARKFAI
ncbi:unnamed protein product, partial [Linum tenue]